jgi:hypothetical protein
MRILAPLILSFLIILYLSASSVEVRADANASGVCGTSQTCNINLSGNSCYPCNQTYYASITNVHWTSSNRTLGFTANGDSGTSATTNVTIPKSAVLNQSAANIKIYVKYALLPSSQVKIRTNSTDFFTAFNVTFASPVNAAISLGIVGVSTFPATSLSLLSLLLLAAIPSLRKKPHTPA